MKTIILILLMATSINASNLNNINPEIVKGYLLPPEPNKALNNSTLLGIDSNNNLLRDDVERWVVMQPWNHQRIAATLQLMRGFQITINEDIGNAKKRGTLFRINDTVHSNKRNYSKLSEELKESDKFESMVLNTPERRKAYRKYDASFSGDITHAFPNQRKWSFRYADYTMEDGTLSSYEFNNEMYFSDELIPLYSNKNGLINSQWSLTDNKRVDFEGNWNDKLCEVNFGIEKNGKECWLAQDNYEQELREKGLI